MSDILSYIGIVMGLMAILTSAVALIRQTKLDKATIASEYQKMASDGLEQIKGLLLRIGTLEDRATATSTAHEVERQRWLDDRHDMVLQISALQRQVDELQAAIRQKKTNEAKL